MYKFFLELVAGFLALVAGIFAAKNSVTIEWLGRGVLTVVGAHATKSDAIAWVRRTCIRVAESRASRMDEG